MTAARKKVTVTIDADLLDEIDRRAKALPATRSGLIDAWLHRARLAAREDDLRAATIAWYDSLAKDQERENEAIARATSLAARRLNFDHAPKPARSKTSARKG